MKKYKLLLFDNCIFQPCNLTCKYCRSTEDNIETTSFERVRKSIEIVKKCRYANFENFRWSINRSRCS